MSQLSPSEFLTSRRTQAGPLEEGPSQLLKALSNLRRIIDERVIINLGVGLGVYNRVGLLGTKLRAVVSFPILPSNGNALCQVWCQAHTVGLQETQI